MPSFGNTRYKWALTVRSERNKRSAICLFVMPVAASRAISRSWVVSFPE